MYKKQRALTDKALFDYYLVSSVRENEICSPFPYYLDKQLFEKMVCATETLDKLVNRIIAKVIEEPADPLFITGKFPLQEEILNLGIPAYPFFWARYDAFQRRDGGIFFSEFNYDKPCAQRETAFSGMFETYNNPNKSFNAKFREGFEDLWRRFDKSGQKPRVAILVDPGHYEEVHLAFLYIDILKELDYELIVVGGDNLVVDGDRVKAFGREVDIILRQFPVEFLHEVNDFKEILELFRQGKVLLINDPRSIIGQAKSLFAYLWEMIDSNNPFLNDEEKKFIRETVPYTKVFNPSMVKEVYDNKDKYVLKAVYGRFSEEVYIGQMHSAEEWYETVQYVLESEKAHILQEFCPIKKEKVLRFDGVGYREYEAFGNFGIYLVNGSFAGTCVRWSTDYLSLDDMVWVSPVGIRERTLNVEDLSGSDRRQKWVEIYDKAAFDKGYTGGYTGIQESFTLQALVVEQEMLDELKTATEDMVRIFEKTTRLVQSNHTVFCPILGISESLSSLVTQNLTDKLTFIGRFDWVMDSSGHLKLLEFNSETPAGLMESIVLNEIISRDVWPTLKNPTKELGEMIANNFSSILGDYSRSNDIRTIGLVSSSYYEDWYNTGVIYECIKHLPFSFVLGEVSGLEVVGDKLYLYGTPLDAVYRYYPLDWFDQDPYYAGVINALNKETPSINPPSTFISQSKAFAALIWELMGQGFYSAKEAAVIEKYLPRTALTPKKLATEDFCAKPYFGREGQGIIFSFAGPVRYRELEDYVFQERVDIQTTTLDIHTATGTMREAVYPVIGAYVVGDKFGGIYTRAGGRVTDKWAVYVPTYVDNV
ncbi:MAG: glutathionylspermidine synthase family protein [Clostridia bacterium]|nr:glutathionylspermidine synthase family protein [Clostridia bacterium]